MPNFVDELYVGFFGGNNDLLKAWHNIRQRERSVWMTAL